MLDKNKPFGEVYGQSETAFEQDGVLFNLQGEELNAPKKEAPKVVKKPKDVVVNETPARRKPNKSVK